LAENRRIVARDYRNRRVGDFLKELHLTEGRGTGFPTIYKALEDNASPPPVMETDEQCTYFLTVLKVNPDFITLINGNKEGNHVGVKESVKESDQVSDEVSDQVGDQVSDQVSDEVKVVLTYCKSPKSRKEILAKIELANHTTNFKRHIVPLLEKQWLKMTIAENPRHRNQKYITTESGEKMLAK